MVEKSGLKVSSTLLEFINNEVIPNTNIDIDKFWNKFSEIVHAMIIIYTLELFPFHIFDKAKKTMKKTKINFVSE